MGIRISGACMLRVHASFLKQFDFELSLVLNAVNMHAPLMMWDALLLLCTSLLAVYLRVHLQQERLRQLCVSFL